MDNYWLEDLESEESLAWVTNENSLTLNELKKESRFQEVYDRALILNSSESRLPYREIAGGFVYDLYTSALSPLGIWRRCSFEDFSKPMPAWQNLLDLDLYCKEHNEEWNYHHCTFSPSGKTVLLHFSFRGKDRRWVREFDLKTLSFVDGGFEIPLSKSVSAWVDDDTLIVGGELPELTNALGYPKTSRVWRRGESEKPVLLSGEDNEFGIWNYNKPLGYRYNTIVRNRNWDHADFFVYSPGDGLQRLHIPEVCREVYEFGEMHVFKLHQNFKNFKAGDVLSVKTEEALRLTEPTLSLIWSTEKTVDKKTTKAPAELVPCKNGFLISYMINVLTRFDFLEFQNGTWTVTPQVVESDLEVLAMEPDWDSKEVYIRTESFATPPTLLKWEKSGMKKIKSLDPSHEGEYVSDQYWCKSKDGEEIPYFIVHKKDLVFDGKRSTLLSGYGGFEISRRPFYSAILGNFWLDQGGIFVVANIRGGGEFGSDWHLSARKENKQRSYDDFIAVAEDLIRRGITTPKNLAIQGGSNGGLLVGAVAMQRPDLFSAVLCEIPLLDMIRYVDLPPGDSWKDEYGDPKDPRMKAVIMKYSPYQNISFDKKYPKIFFMTSITDDRVHPSHARRMAHKMKSLNKDCYLYEEPSGGHGGGNVAVKALNSALRYSYLWKHTT